MRRPDAASRRQECSLSSPQIGVGPLLAPMLQQQLLEQSTIPQTCKGSRYGVNDAPSLTGLLRLHRNLTTELWRKTACIRQVHFSLDTAVCVSLGITRI